MDWTVYWFMFPGCIAIATLAMLSGISGAALLSPAIILGFPIIGVPALAPASAIGMSLFTEAFGFGSGVFGYWSRKLIDYQVAGVLVLVAIPSSLLASFFSHATDPNLLKGIYGAMAVGLGLFLLATQKKQEVLTPEPSLLPTRVLRTADGVEYRYQACNQAVGAVITGLGAAMAGLISVGIGEVQMGQLVRRCKMPVPVAAGTSVLIVACTVAGASVAHIGALLHTGGLSAIPWNLIVYTVPGALIGGQIGSRLQGRVSHNALERGIAGLFVFIGLVFVYTVLRP